MATLEQENTARNFLKTELPKFSQLNPKDFARDSELGTQFGFSEGLPYFERIVNLYKELSQVDLSGVPFSALDPLAKIFVEAIKLFQKIKELDTKKSANPNADREALINTARDQYDSHFQRGAPVLAYTTRKGTNFEDYERKAKVALESVEKLAQEISEKGRAAEASAEKILNKLQEEAAKLGAGQHSINFKLQSDEHKRVSFIWLVFTWLSVALGAFLVWYFFLGPQKVILENLTAGQAIYLVASRIMLFSVVSFVIYWAAKNHGAHQHNYVINKHRQNALATFQTFIEAAGSDQSVKNAVLLQAGQAIYGQQCTGYSDGISSPAAPVNLIEVVKNVAER